MFGWLWRLLPEQKQSKTEKLIGDLLYFYNVHKDKPGVERNAWGIPMEISPRGRMLMAMTEIFPITPSNVADWDPEGNWPGLLPEEFEALVWLRRDGLAEYHSDGNGLGEWHLTRKAGKWYRAKMFEDWHAAHAKAAA